ncbi:hypothetical protein Htur_0392 [Haloterrigena turkmenica DSM 5511]|uniref:Uncharacterized protein n=1 Tax=Haloterrigena turkmenica (strain ATCC 51198 / DSM 5511 / JCM 9101 / NCIMB 13204 / VKM B-1734 / 4k) TaxID=543526 RepID=D2RUZ9_HALTV|nr:hypothetical protein [Haloterrigena turkmenica]ADB59292.1 hypothetical protein Htur_0392 [Haloterrigena turkmenica DSM 5511]
MTTDDASRWTELLEDAAAIAEEFRDNGWDAVVLEPEVVAPVDREDRAGLDVGVSGEEYALVESLIARGDVTVSAADVYYRPPESDDEARIALVVERDEDTETSVFVPLRYDLEDEATRSMFEAALASKEVFVHVTPAEAAGATTDDEPGNWVSFSHDDPSLFLEEADVRNW